MTPEIVYRDKPALTNAALNGLFLSAWPDHIERDYQPVLAHSLVYSGAYHQEELIGFINLAWDGGRHAFILDPTVHPAWRRQGLGRSLVERTLEVARAHGVEWVHVDFESRLTLFYARCGFRPTAAGLIHLT